MISISQTPLQPRCSGERGECTAQFTGACGTGKAADWHYRHYLLAAALRQGWRWLCKLMPSWAIETFRIPSDVLPSANACCTSRNIDAAFRFCAGELHFTSAASYNLPRHPANTLLQQPRCLRKATFVKDWANSSKLGFVVTVACLMVGCG